MDFKMHTCLQSIITSKSHSEVPWVSLSHMGTPKLDAFLEEKNISLEKSAENVHGWLELQHGLRGQMLSCCSAPGPQHTRVTSTSVRETCRPH